MALSGLKGSFPLTRDAVDKEVRHISPGVFALGNLADGKFQTQFVGRSDTNLAQKLKTCIGHATRFKFEQYEDAKQAFEKECELFHLFKPRGNKQHPQRPETRNWSCPGCAYYG